MSVSSIRIGIKAFLTMKDKYVIDYLREMTESLESINAALQKFNEALSMLPKKEKEETNADDKQTAKKGGRKKKSSENDGGPGVEGEALQHNEMEKDKGSTH